MDTCRNFDGCTICGELRKLSPETCEKYIQRYCKGDYEKCARYMVSSTLGRASVPSAMLPTETDRALRLIGRSRKVD